MSHTLMMAQHPPCFAAVRAAANKRPPSQPPRKPQRQKPATTTSNGFGGEKKSPVWQCVENCGACCKLDKGPTFPSAEEIFDDPSDIEVYKSLVGEDGWCIHYDKRSRKCSIYNDRPYFCRVEPEIFDILYGIDKRSFNKEACRYYQSCVRNKFRRVGKVQPCNMEKQLEMMDLAEFCFCNKRAHRRSFEEVVQLAV